MLNPSLEGGVLFERQIGAARWSLEIEGDGELLLVIVDPGHPTAIDEPTDIAQTAESFRGFLAAHAST